MPYVEVVLHVDAPGDQVRKAVSAALEGTVGDVIVTLVAPWSQLPEGRHPVIDDPFFDLRLLREHFSHDERVRRPTRSRAPPPRSRSATRARSRSRWESIRWSG